MLTRRNNWQLEVEKKVLDWWTPDNLKNAIARLVRPTGLLYDLVINFILYGNCDFPNIDIPERS